MQYYCNMDRALKSINDKLYLHGYIYLRSRDQHGKIYWDCDRVRAKDCRARAITPQEGVVIIIHRGPDESPHDHPPDREAAETDIVRTGLKRQAEENIDQPPAQIL